MSKMDSKEYREILRHTRSQLQTNDPQFYQGVEEKVDLDGTSRENLLEYLDTVIETYESFNEMVDEIFETITRNVGGSDDVNFENKGEEMSMNELRVEDDFIESIKEVRNEVQNS